MDSQTLYQQAQFQKLKSIEKPDIYVLAAHCFTGDHQRTRWLAEDLGPQTDPFAQAFVNFHLGVSLTRTSHYKKASALFKKNRQLCEQYPDLPMVSFLAWQGLGFFHYFFSHHSQSLKAAQRGRRALDKIKNKGNKTLFQILSLDLEGHNLIHRYRIHKGVEVLQSALRLAQDRGVESFAQSLQLSILLYTCQFLKKPIEAIEILKKALAEIPTDDDYSRSEIVCLISNLLMLTGRFQDAQDYLSEHYKVIYQTENKRQMGQLNFRMTYNMFRRGSFEQALYLGKTARSNLNPITDRNLIAKILGLEIQILVAMGEPTDKARQVLEQLNAKIDSLYTRRANLRTLETPGLFNEGEDPCGDLVDRLRQGRSKNLYKDIKTGEYFGLLADFFSMKPGDEFVVVNAPDGDCIVSTKESCHVLQKKMGPTLTKLLIQIGTGNGEKEELIKSVWGYSEYDPLRHDSLIYSSVARLRTLLAVDEGYLFFDGKAYRCTLKLVNDLQQKNQNKTTNAPATKPAPFSSDAFLFPIPEDLNYRQIQILKTRRLEPISVKSYSNQFAVTTMTALRDLKKLCELGYLKKTGRARSTRYLKAKNP